MKVSYESSYSVTDFTIDSLKENAFPATVRYNFELQNTADPDIIYFNPMLESGQKTNPFAAMTRHYPVEMPYKQDETYVLNMEIPAGYQIDELPKSARVAFNETEGMFEYLIQKGDTDIQMRVRLRLNKAFFSVEDYASLRDFFGYVVSKESEQIVFKKIK